MEGGRFKSWTDAETNCAILGVESLKQEDEGLYKCVLTNGGEEVVHEFNLYVTGEYTSRENDGIVVVVAPVVTIVTTLIIIIS